MNWQEIINEIAPTDEDKSKLFFTKEDYELLASYMESSKFKIMDNIRDFGVNLTSSSCGMERLIKFFTTRKIGNILVQNHKNKLDSQTKMLEIYVNNITAHLEALSNIADSFSFDPTADIKQAAISVIIQTQAVIQLNNLTTIREDLQELIQKDNLCLGSCPDVC